MTDIIESARDYAGSHPAGHWEDLDEGGSRFVRESGVIEVFYADGSEDGLLRFIFEDGTPAPRGWYYGITEPGCLFNEDPSGPYDTSKLAYESAVGW